MIRLTLPWPISANRYWASRVIKPANGGRMMAMTYVTPEAKEYRQHVSRMCRAAGIREPLVGRVAISVRLYPNRPQDWALRQRKHGDRWDDTVMCMDLDNANKVLLDAIKGIAIEDDRWVFRLVSERMEPDAKGARVELSIEAIEVAQPQVELL